MDFGIRGLDLADALQDDYETVVFVEASPRGEEPGTVYLIEPEIEDGSEVSLDTHGMDPVKVLRLARAMGGKMPKTLVVGCEPQNILNGEAYDFMLKGLSEPVEAAVEQAAKLVESLVEEMHQAESKQIADS